MKKALITGASRGIGRAIVEKLKDEYELFLICKNNSDLMSDLPGRHYAGDVGDQAFVKEVFKDIDELDLLINNAGIAYFDIIQDITCDKWDEVIRTDLTSVYNTSRLAASLMVPRQHILCMGLIRSFLRIRLFRCQRRSERFHESPRKRACPLRRSRERPGIRSYRYRYE